MAAAVSAVSEGMSTNTDTNSTDEIFDVAILGGGLSGITTALRVADRGLSYVVLEAHRHRFGGRLANTPNSGIDLGAAWVWPQHGQHRVSKLLGELGIGTFPQPGDHRNSRVIGGTYSLVENILKRLNPKCLRLGFAVTSITEESRGIILQSSNSEKVVSKFVVLAAPPRKLIDVSFFPELSKARLAAMRNVRTWMAGVTKVVVHFPEPFWRRAAHQGIANIGLSSRQGPAFQVYDASSFQDESVALTFFALAPAQLSSADKNDELAKACCFQLAATWRKLGVAPQYSHHLMEYCRDDEFASKVFAQRWPHEQHISDETQPVTIHSHPRPVPALAKTEWSGKLLFAGTESDQHDPGVIEGAIGAAYRVLEQLDAQLAQLGTTKLDL